MTAVRVTQRTALDGLARAVQQRGEDHFVQIPPYASKWRYVDDGEPVCIVAAALAQLGYTKGELVMLDSSYNRFMAGDIATIARKTDLVDLTPAAAKVLLAAQRSSDAGEAWGDALDAARVAARHTRKDDL